MKNMVHDVVTLIVAGLCFVGMWIEAHIGQDIYTEVSFGITAILLLVLNGNGWRK